MEAIARLKNRLRDPRYYQIAVLTSLVTFGVVGLDFGIRLPNALAIVATALFVQWLGTRINSLPKFDPLSPLITSLSLTLLLRTDMVMIAALAACIAIGSKFLIRVNGKHVFNPANIAIVSLMLASDHAWISTGQWGNAAIGAFALACLGFIVLTRAKRSETTIAFLVAYASILFGRALWLGDPFTIPMHQIQNGALLIFAFFMISDPKTTPDSPLGRVLYASLVASVAGIIQFVFYEPNAPVLALIICAPVVPLIDRVLRGQTYRWDKPSGESRQLGPVFRKGVLQMRYAVLIISAVLTITLTSTAQAFCGFYVAKADTTLFNRASQVVLVRDGDRTVLTMANDFEGDVEDFAVVIPVPTFIEEGQINVADKALIDHLDAYTSPRLVEYFDSNPCLKVEYDMLMSGRSMPQSAVEEISVTGARAKGVTIEASYTVGEYDILILSAEESDGLIEWLNENGYRVPDGAEEVVGSYLRQDMRFFVAKVNLEVQAASGFSYLRPLQVAYESNKFMLPIRLGTLNAAGTQELYVYALTRTGRVETTNYRTVKLPSNTEVPVFIKADFANFYRDMFATQYDVQNQRAVFLEYAWDMAWCDPCAADPLSADELRRLGVFWTDAPQDGRIAPSPAQNVFVTRLHVRYDQEHFPEDLIFQETGDRQNFQGRYVVRHAWEGEATCDISQYEAQLRERQEREAQQLANLTGWDIDEIRGKMPLIANLEPEEPKPWWARLWN